MMRFSTAFAVTALSLLVGCVSTGRYGTDRDRQPSVSHTLSEIPEYSPRAGNYDVSAGVCVYETLWIAKPIATALERSGYTVLPNVPLPGTLLVDRPDFIVEPLAFRHFPEQNGSETWLYTRMVVQVRRPLKTAFGETGAGLSDPPRIFQVYARRKLAPGAVVNEAEYRQNIDVAAANLMCIPEFRDALTKKQTGNGTLRPVAEFCSVKPDGK